ncbi:sel1 repeat family protein [Desulfovibrio sp. OttesenSCG-928-M16]|nr:sel1 repeat family protein [Desulfovibrio sp. OttesenSCG-928-M16]
MRCITSLGLPLVILCLICFLFQAAPCHAAPAPQGGSPGGKPPASPPVAPQQQAIRPEALFAAMLVNAEKGQPQAMLTVGTLYEQGIGVPRNFTKALEWYTKAANAGDRDAWMSLGVCYEIGIGTTADPDKALAAYTRSASLGFHPAQYKLADMYLKGRGVARDESKGFDYLNKAAEGRESAAMFDMGVVLGDGLFGRKAEPEKARQWFTKAAEAGHAQSILSLADMLKNGQGGKANPEEALRWYLIGQKGGMSGEPLDAVIAELRDKLPVAKSREVEEAADAWIAAKAKSQGQTQPRAQPEQGK